MCHVLVIEDDPYVAMLIEDVLLAEGADRVVFACTADDAIAAAAQDRPDFITSDVHLLQGSGPEAVRVIHQACGEMPVLFITATPDACTPCAPPGRVLTKPASTRQIANAFREMVSVPRAC